MENIRIGTIDNPEKLWDVLEVMKDAWQMPDYTEAVPPHFLRAIQDNGGLLLAAYNGDEIIGFVLGIIGRENDNFYHYSHMVGVKRKYWRKGIALQLKLSQREWALKNGYKLVMWTYDPYQGLNANFNFSKLGVICNRYYEDYYGIMKDGINKGLITDRFKVEWWIDSWFVKEKIKKKKPFFEKDKIFSIASHVVHTFLDSENDRMIKKIEYNFSNRYILIEIPSDINSLKKKSVKKANDWKIKLRPVFKKYFEKGYIIIDFYTMKNREERRNFYLLVREKKERILNGEIFKD